MDKINIIRELNKMKGFTQMKAACLQRNHEIKGHALDENQFLPNYRPELPVDLVERINEFSQPLQIRRCCDFRDVKGPEPTIKTPARPKAVSVGQLIGGWWKNNGG